MSTSTDTYVRARIDSASKVRAAEALGKMGLTISDAIRLLLHRVVEDGRLPFDPVPNEVTRAAMLEARHAKGPGFKTVADLMADLRSDE
ncbi:type II toxin-antitoxin system RelB/DinJ family antitoxin [Polaromonas sp. JS666]|uniref:type II toxin-antitoxin system RelB/DinJ family antitoxin n=1 Tax=Polaromonas sp. (strain JS666 / ATCC BAA-500) TaxID=296591 RepID=UPI000046457F|nr:type II toxin-antitoxin system RelB/DinJ family antitoxin [Polaromonas sp. JS666]ABE43853.1 RelB antitoxin [Polaromonas sp. JS666]